MNWKGCKNVLCVRPDNMGDLLMSSPAIRALKETFHCRITVITSSMASDVVQYLPAVDDHIVWDLPWVKGDHTLENEDVMPLIGVLQGRKFDAAVIFTVFSQNPLPTALLLSMAGIPERLAYCRENPYRLLTQWVPEKEPYSLLRHQVRRDLDLVRAIGANTDNDRTTLNLKMDRSNAVNEKLAVAGVDATRPWVIIHPGVSEKKREYPLALWTELGKKIAAELSHQLVITGIQKERSLAGQLAEAIGPEAYNLAGSFDLAEFITLLKIAPLMITVNSGSTHLAAAAGTRIIVLYALTNPQHLPWKATGRAFPFPVPGHLHSRNEVLKFVQENIFRDTVPMVSPDSIVQAAREILIDHDRPLMPELISTQAEEIFRE